MAFRALRQTLPAIGGAASTAAGIGWYLSKTPSTGPSALDTPLSHTSTIGSTFEEAAPLAMATASPLDVCWASSANANVNASISVSVNDNVCPLPFDSYITLNPPTTSNAIQTALATFLLLALLEIAFYYAFILGQRIERYVSRNVPYSVRSILSVAYQTYYRLAGIGEIALLALNFFGAVNTSKLPMWLHFLIVAGAILYGLWDFETEPLPDTLDLQAQNSELRMRIEKLKQRNVRNVSSSAKLTHTLKATSQTKLVSLKREHQKEMSAIEKQHKKTLTRVHIGHRLRLSSVKMQLGSARKESTSKIEEIEKQHKKTLARSRISHRLRLSGLKMQLSSAREEADLKITEAQQVIDGHVSRISGLEQTMMKEKMAHTTTVTEAQQLIKQNITEKMEMETAIAEANGLIKQSTTNKMEMEATIAKANEIIKDLFQAHSTGQKQLRTSQRMVRILSKHGQTLLHSLALLTVQFQQRIEASEKVYFESIFKARLESRMAMEAVIQQFGYDFARSQGIGHSNVQSTSAGANPQDQEHEQEPVMAKPSNAIADFKFDTASILPTLWEEAKEPTSHVYKKTCVSGKQGTPSTRRSRPVMSRPMRASMNSPASSGGPSLDAWALPALDSFANNGFTPSASQPSLTPPSTMSELPTGENAREPSPAATAVDASEIDVSTPVAVPHLVAVDNPSESSGFAVVTSDTITPLTSSGGNSISQLQGASQSVQSTADPSSSDTVTAAGSSIVRPPPVPYRESKDEWNMNLCKSGENCIGRWSDYDPKKGKYIVNNNNSQRWGSGYKPVEGKLAGRAKSMELCCDCFKQLHPEIIQEYVQKFLDKEANKTEEDKAKDVAKQAHKNERKRAANAAKAEKKVAAAAAAEEAAEEDN